MALTVTLVTPAIASQLSAARTTLNSGFNPAWSCSRTTVSVPTLAWLRACVDESPPKHEVAFVRNGATLAGLVVVHLASKRIVWLLVPSASSASIAAVVAVVGPWAIARYGVAKGDIDNPTVQAAVAAGGARVVDGVHMQFGG